jgi:nucleoside-diphosphate-sugar epimerase
MKVFLSGATRVLGRRIIERFTKAGHSVVGLARNDENEAAIKAAGGTPRRADLFDAASLADAAKGCDTLIHAATSLRGMRRPTKKRVGHNDRVRRAGAQAMAEAAGAVGAKMFLFPSIVWLVRPDDGTAFDESSPYNPDRISASAMVTERILQRQAKESGFELAILRLGFLYSADSEQTRFMGEGLGKGRMGPFGKKEAEWAMLHADDAADAILAAAKHGASGTWHVVDDEPVDGHVFLSALAERLGAREPSRIPKILGRLVVGGAAVRLLSTPIRTSNQAFKKATGWKPTYATYEKGLDEVVRAWRKEGFPERIKPPKDDGQDAEPGE